MKKRDKTLVFIVEDNSLFAESVKFGIEKDVRFKVFHFDNKNEALAALVLNPDIVILDYNLDENDDRNEHGNLILEHICQNYPKISTLMLTGSTDIEIAKKLLEKGAMDYIVKDDQFFENLRKSMQHICDLNLLETDIKALKLKSKKYKRRMMISSLALSALFVLFYLFVK
jgi:DNA-binding NtrC family response regulator